MNSIKAFLYKYRHAWILSYSFIYIPWFCYLEKTVTRNYHVMHVALDDFIPFNEYFIIPYMMWFLYVAGTIVFFLFRNKEDYYRICTFLFSGMTISLIICTFFPNGQDLRPVVFERENMFVDAVRVLYRTDTCTNVFPSLHVFNSLCACIAIHESEKVRTHKAVCISAYVLAGLIILATMFLKQHSVLDVIGAAVMAFVLYQIVYAPEKKRVPGYMKRAVLQENK